MILKIVQLSTSMTGPKRLVLDQSVLARRSLSPGTSSVILRPREESLKVTKVIKIIKGSQISHKFLIKQQNLSQTGILNSDSLIKNVITADWHRPADSDDLGSDII